MKIVDAGVTIVIAALLCAACGDSSSNGGGGAGGGLGGNDTGGNSSAGGASSTGGAGGIGPTVTYSGSINEITASGQVPLGGVHICAENFPSVPCVDAADDSTYVWPGLPANAQVLIRASKTDYLDSTTFLVTGDTDVTGYTGALIQRGTAMLLYATLNVQYDETKASVAATVVKLDDTTDPPSYVGISGATVTMTPASGTGPVYAADSGLPDLNATATAMSGGAVWGATDPGDVVFTANAPGMTCGLGRYGWPSTDGDASGTTSADTVSFVEILCQ